MTHTPMQHWTPPLVTELKTFEEWLDEPFFEFVGRPITRRMWWMDNEIAAAKEAWEEARK